jgi:hypothetical protein
MDFDLACFDEEWGDEIIKMEDDNSSSCGSDGRNQNDLQSSSLSNGYYSSDDFDAQPLKKKKRDRSNRRLHPFPRIVKNDIRRMYPNMLLNVLNAVDFALLTDFFGEFGVQHCVMIDNFPGTKQLSMSWCRSIIGTDSIVKYLGSWIRPAQCLIPDFAVTLRSAAIRQYLKRQESAVECNITYSATVMFEFPDPFVVIQQDGSANEEFVMSLDANSPPTHQAYRKKLMTQPFHMSFDGSVIFYLDERCRIAQLAFGPALSMLKTV